MSPETDLDPAIYADTQAIKGTGFVAGTHDLVTITSDIAAIAAAVGALVDLPYEIHVTEIEEAQLGTRQVFAIQVYDTTPTTGGPVVSTSLNITGSVGADMTIDKSTQGAAFANLGSTIWLKANGRFYFEYQFTAANFNAGDTAHIYPDGVHGLTVTIGGNSYFIPIPEWTVDIVTPTEFSAAQTTHSQVANVLEQTVATGAGGVQDAHSLKTFWLDMVNFAAIGQVVTIRVKHDIDGTNYRTFLTYQWNLGDDPGVALSLNVWMVKGSYWQITMQCAIAEAGATSVPIEGVSSFGS